MSDPKSEPRRPRSARNLARAAKIQMKKEQVPEKNFSKVWTTKEKEDLLQALRDHGSGQVQAIAQRIPTRTEENIKSFMSQLKRSHNLVTKVDPDEPHRRQHKVRRERDTPIDTWIGITEGKPPIAEVQARRPISTSEAVPPLFQMIAKFEKHPTMANEDSVDYPAIYEAIAMLMQGEAPKDLNSATSLKMVALMKRLFMEISDPAMAGWLREEKQRLERYTFGSSLSLDQTGWEERNLVAGTNLFNFPPEMFQAGAFRQPPPPMDNSTSQNQYVPSIESFNM